MKKNILITGMPRSGKSTLLNKLIFNDKEKTGFVTNEVLDELGNRIGFDILTSKGIKYKLARKKLDSEFKVSSYGIDINSLEMSLENLLDFNDTELLYIDEIGEMELFSLRFQDIVLDYLNSKNQFIGTVSQIYLNDFIDNIKNRDDVILFELDETNRKEIEYKINLILNDNSI